MIKRTFVHLPGVGLRTEAQFWRQGLATWEDFLTVRRVSGLGAERLAWLQGLLEESLRHLHRPEYFASCLPTGELWRLFHHFRSRTAYLDIETTGAGWWEQAVTVVGLYDGQVMRQFVLGHNLMDFPEALADVDVLVTFTAPSLTCRCSGPTFQTSFSLPCTWTCASSWPVWATGAA